MKLVLWLGLGLMLPVTAFAQEPQETEKDKAARTNYVHVFAGRFLPSAIVGAYSIYPYWGARFGHSLPIFDPEYSVFFVRAKGVIFYTGSVSLTFPFEVEGLKFIGLLGADAHLYKGVTLSTGETDYIRRFSFHLGLSPLIGITKTLFLRTDFKMSFFGGGRTLNVGTGLAYYF
jgi:hypothetical protein